jgi:hypothetical protein
MKIKVIFIITAAAMIALASCTKTLESVTIAQGSLNVTNAVIGGSAITVTTNNSIVSSSNTVGSNAYARFPLAGGKLPVSLGVPAVAATPTSAAIPAVTYYSNTLTVSSSSNYSLFLAGASPSAIDNVLISENYPYAYADSTCGVRFIHLATGSNPISVNIKGNANGSEVSSLAYKAYSGFNKYAAKKVNTSYIFEFRDATSGTLLTSYTLTTPYFHNVTLCLRGKTGAYGVILDYNY